MNPDDKAKQQLRAAAEAELAQRPPGLPQGEGDAQRLLLELQVHQIELEMQNEALRQAQEALEESRDQYFDLYEFAPVGYLTLSADGLIAQINLTGAKLLGRERDKLLLRPLRAFVMGRDEGRWMRLSRRQKPAASKAASSLNCSAAMARYSMHGWTARRSRKALRECALLWQTSPARCRPPHRSANSPWP
jgi:PAS domain-containing protein